MLIAKQQLLLDVKGTYLDICINYLVDKQSKVKFNTAPPFRGLNILDLAHNNVYFTENNFLVVMFIFFYTYW